jgi:hypothetical protein
MNRQIFVNFIGDQVSGMNRARVSMHKSAVYNFFNGSIYTLSITDPPDLSRLNVKHNLELIGFENIVLDGHLSHPDITSDSKDPDHLLVIYPSQWKLLNDSLLESRCFYLEAIHSLFGESEKSKLWRHMLAQVLYHLNTAITVNRPLSNNNDEAIPNQI